MRFARDRHLKSREYCEIPNLNKLCNNSLLTLKYLINEQGYLVNGRFKLNGSVWVFIFRG